MIKTLGIPIVNRGDLLLRCVSSIDEPIHTLFIINNGTSDDVAGAIHQIKERAIVSGNLFTEIRVERYKNLGCSRSWNRIMAACPGPWLISGNDMKFMPGSVKKINDALAANPDASIVCADGYAIFCMTPLGIQKVGLFDENFYPAYYEDLDHFRRVQLSGAKAVGVPDFKFVHGEAPHWGSATLKSDPGLEKKFAIFTSNLREYYIRKWGGEPGKEKFTRPYNRSVALDFVEIDKVLFEKNSI